MTMAIITTDGKPDPEGVRMAAKHLIDAGMFSPKEEDAIVAELLRSVATGAKAANAITARPAIAPAVTPAIESMLRRPCGTSALGYSTVTNRRGPEK